MIPSALKTLWEKSLDSATSHPLPIALSLWPSHEGPSLAWDFLILEIHHIHHIVKCARRKLPSTLPGTSPGPMEVDERAPSRCTTPIPCLCESEPSTLIPVPGSLIGEKPPLLLLPIEPFLQWTQGLPWENNSQPHAYTLTPS